MVIWIRVISGGWVFRVGDSSRVYEILNFMFKVDIDVYEMSNGLVKVAIAI